MHHRLSLLVALQLLILGQHVGQGFIDRYPGGAPVFHDGTSVMPLDLLSIGTGAAWFDANVDGNLDLFVTMRTGNNLLYIGDGKGGFIESAVAYQVHDATGDGSGVAIADFNNDGYPDMFLANSKSDRLLRNDGGTVFTDITGSSGIDMTDESRGTSASWVDFDGDGFLDLYIANHVPLPDASNADTQDHLYRNNGNETFSDKTNLLSEAGNISGATFIGGWMDYDLDGDQDLFVINDCVLPNETGNKVFRNDGDTHMTLSWNFTEVSNTLGVDSCANAMGVAMGDYNRDGYPDYYFSNIGPAILFEGNGSGFADVSSAAGVDGQPWPLFSWGTCFFDADLDGWEDLFLILGSHHYTSSTDPYEHDNMFFLNDANGTTFTDKSNAYNLADSTRGRTVIAGDYDNDGDRDLALINYGEDIMIKENNLEHDYHYLEIRLCGTVSNRDGIGSRIRIKTPDGAVQWRQTLSGSSLGGGDQRSAHFGLGTQDKVDSVTIYWPVGGIQHVTDVMADQTIVIKEFDTSSPVMRFSDVALANGIDGFCGACGIGNGLSFADFNGDGLDDLTFGTQPNDSVLFYQNTGNGFVKLPSLTNCDDRTRAILWFDYDDDGDQDLMLGNFEAQNRLYRNDGNLNLVDITSTCGILMMDDPTYSLTASDYDKDGDLDFYVGNWTWNPSNADHHNYLYRNEGLDSFTNVTSIAGVADGDKLTLACAFFDYNNDGWPDLYNSQDRWFDKNTLFHNNGDGTFTDVSIASNSDVGIDAMNVGIGDYNNDDFMDIYITNTVGSPNNTHLYNVLLKNQGNGTFAEVAGDAGVEMFDVTWGGNFVDFDLDKDLDLYVSAMHLTSTSSSDMFVNQYPLDTFFSVEPPGMEGDTVNSFANAIGDFNNDGLPDIAVNNSNTGAIVTTFDLWENQSNVNGHWLKLRLHGVMSNRDAIGSKIEYFIDGQKYIRYTQAGTAFEAQNSFTEILGTGTSHTVDSLKVIWPSSGMVSTFYEVVTGQTMHIYETDVIYVDKFAAGEDNGLNWTDAFTDLQDALTFSKTHHVKEIWIKAGTYYPDLVDRSKSFVISDGVAIYGGFAGTETMRSQRDPGTNMVVLSGDIGVQAVSTDNTYHVVTIPVDVDHCTIDGVTIANGYADGVGAGHKIGGGMLCRGAVTCEDVIIQNCFAEEDGAALHATGWRSDVVAKDLTLQANSSPSNNHVASTALATIKVEGINEIKN